MSMDLKINAPKIHNRFDIYKNGEQVAYAENIILNAMWTTLCNTDYPFARILYGTGTGTLSPTRTTLFTYLGYKDATLVERVYADPTSYLRQSIELGLTNNNGAVLTEVGIGNSTSVLQTHAMLRDMNGNPVSITKTSVDILTIYATLYAVIDDSHPTLKMITAPRNGLIWQILSNGTPSSTVKAGNADYLHDFPNGLGSYLAGTTSTIGSWTADVANKRKTLATPRFNVGDANSDIAEFTFADVARMVLPASGIYAGLDIIGATVGTGDGATSKFLLPSRNVNQTGILIKVDGVETTAYTKELVNKSINFAISQPSTTTNYVQGCALSSDGLVLAVAHFYGSRVTTYARSTVNDKWVKRADPAVLPASDGLGCSLSSDGLVLAVAHNTSPFITTYDWTAGAWIKRANPAILPASDGRGCSLTPDGLILAVAHGSSPYITTYDWTAGAWVKRADPAILPAGTGNGCSLSSDGLILAVALNTSPFITTYDWTAGAWVKRADPAILPAGTGNGCSLSSDGLILAVAHYGSPYFSIYDWTSGAWIKRANPANLPNDQCYSCVISSDKSFVVTPTNNANALYSYDLRKRQTEITFDTPPAVGAVITADYTVNGIHKTATRVIDLTFTIQFGEPT